MSGKERAIEDLHASRAAIDETFAALPDAALAWLKPGDDYAIGGVAIHLIQSLDGYIATVDALHRAGYRDTEGPSEDESIVDAGLARARRGIAPNERRATFAEMAGKEQRLAELAARASDEDFGRVVGVTYPGDEVPYPTSVALVLHWMTEHFNEHVPHVRELFAEWQKAR